MPVFDLWQEIESHVRPRWLVLGVRNHVFLFLLSSIPANRLICAEHDRNEKNPEDPPHQMHTDKVIAIVEMGHDVLRVR